MGMTVLNGLIQNATLLLALALAHGLFITRLPRDQRSTQVLAGLLFGLTALLGMIYPVTVGPLIFDGRTVVIGIAGLFGGLPAAAISGLIAALYRGWLGGPGIWMGIATIVTAVIFGALFHRLRRSGQVRITVWTLWLFGLALHLVALGWTVLLPAALRVQVLTDVALPFLVVLPAIAVLLGLLLREQERRVDDERALRESEARLREARSFLSTLIATIPDLIWLKDPEGIYLACNPRFERFFGATEAEIKGRRDADFLSAAEAAAFRQHDLKAITSGGLTVNQETLTFADDGHQEQVETIKTPMFDAEGQLIGVLGIARNIGSQLQTLEALKRERDRIHELHERIEKIAAHVPGMVYQYQRWPDGRSAFPYASQGVKAIYGMDAATVAEDASPVFAVLHPDDLERIQVSIERSAIERTIWRETYRVRFPDGRTQWVEGEASPQGQPDGSVLWHGYIHNVTERKHAETQLRLAASVFAHSLEGIVITDAENRIVDANPSFTRITGYGKEELLGRDPKILASGRHDAKFYQRMWAAICDDGFWQGEIWNRRKDTEVYPELLSISVVRDATGEVRHHIGVFSDISQFKAHEAELNRIAHYDHLTSLPNRRLLTDRLEFSIAQVRRKGSAIAVCYLDLDGFKPINDRFGHAVGDRFLVKVAKALGQVVRAEDTVARLGGDEFVLLLNNLAQPQDCFDLLPRILAAVRDPIQIGDLVHSLSASIGVTLCPPDIADPDTLLRHADQAMYQAKESGKNTYHLYDAQQDQLLQARRQKLERIGLALQQDELVLHFQPQVNMISREVIRVEALVRWQHPEQGLLMPAAFLPDIEGTELEVKLDQWVIEQVLKQLETWKREWQRFAVSLNIGARHLLRPDFASRLEEQLRAHPDVAGEDLELEILETATLSDFDQAQRVLAACRAFGVHFALDDFGTGYSSLAYFRALPVDVLKIDQSFVRDMLHDPGDKEIVESVVQLSHAFNRPVIAEGVETLAHAAMLTWLGCRFGQGYGIARPMPAAELPDWVSRWSAEDVWSDLEITQARDDLPLMLAAQNHRHWLHGFLKQLEQAEADQLANLRPDDRDFGRWYAGPGRRRYKTFAEFQPIGVKYERMQAVAADLLSRIRCGEIEPTAESLKILQKASDDLLTEIGRLIHRVTPSARPPS
ncbi:MAG: EAL domain-containing protein [Lamprobacter sp.]|uniref:EAL domain-containing protein n=1 Tax=Lamprobacter sp. TaxID=3100796 RepID=UPI002B261CBD|nr:EAL domain-containing protein [Lamprobacter sp.]MEA3641332.1 EAL domain-containing protein [Lamprobacter sp.]